MHKNFGKETDEKKGYVRGKKWDTYDSQEELNALKKNHPDDFAKLKQLRDENKKEALETRNLERYGYKTLPTPANLTFDHYKYIKDKLDMVFDYDKTGMRTMDSLIKELDKIASEEFAYLMTIADMDNFKKYNTQPLNYWMADDHLIREGKKMVEEAEAMGKRKNGNLKLQPFHMHGDEYMFLSVCDSLKENASYFEKVSGTVDVRIYEDDEQGEKVWNPHKIEGLPIPGKVTLSGGMVMWTTSRDSKENLASFLDAKERATKVADIAKKQPGKACIMFDAGNGKGAKLIYQVPGAAGKTEICDKCKQSIR